MPSSAMAATAAGLTASAGADPAERTSTASPARWRRKAAAIWERPALWTQRKSTTGVGASVTVTVTPEWLGRLGSVSGGDRGAG